jgi:hypothetical protein
MNRTHERLVVDEIGYTEALSAISQVAGQQPIKLIYLYAPIKVRESKISNMGGLRQLHEIDDHPVERPTSTRFS